jgi:hypothetical protein
MISIERIDKAINKLNAYIKGIPPDELRPDNIEYVKREQLIKALSSYRPVVAKLDKMLTELGA